MNSLESDLLLLSCQFLPDEPSLIAGEGLHIYVHIFTQNGCAALCILGEEGGAVLRKYRHGDSSLRNSSYW